MFCEQKSEINLGRFQLRKGISEKSGKLLFSYFEHFVASVDFVEKPIM